MIRERIKSETAQQHKALEQIAFTNAIMSKTLTEEQYKAIIEANLIANMAFEQQWNSLPFELPESLMLQARYKTEALKKDATALGIEIPQTVDYSFPTANKAAFMGSLYVFEGSTLGGAVILKQLTTNNNLNHIKEHNFYGCYGEKLGYLWKVFLDHLVEITQEDEVEVAIKAAQDTFSLNEEIFKAVIKNRSVTASA
jgi:heme oxygenase